MSLAVRVIAAVLALGMLVSPSVAQVQAAERCRDACADPSPKSTPSCCAMHTGSNPAEDDPADRDDSRGDDSRGDDSRGNDSDVNYCPGCNGRPLISTPAGPTIPLVEATPIFATAIDSETSPSFDVAFAIFHPPRA